MHQTDTATVCKPQQMPDLMGSDGNGAFVTGPLGGHQCDPISGDTAQICVHSVRQMVVDNPKPYRLTPGRQGRQQRVDISGARIRIEGGGADALRLGVKHARHPPPIDVCQSRLDLR